MGPANSPHGEWWSALKGAVALVVATAGAVSLLILVAAAFGWLQ